MKKMLAVLAVLVICFQFVPFAFAQGGEWTCPECGNVNTGLFCGACGRPKETPSPTPSPAPTPSPTPKPETWQCYFCRGNNPWDNVYCNYCGVKKTTVAGTHFENPVAPLYLGMTKKEVKQACGGEYIYNFNFHGYPAHVDYLYNSDGKLYRIYVSVSSSKISYYRFLDLLMQDFWYAGWSGVMLLDDYKTPYSAANLDEASLVAVGTETDNMLAIDLHISWDNIKAGRELVKQEAENQP